MNNSATLLSIQSWQIHLKKSFNWQLQFDDFLKLYLHFKNGNIGPSYYSHRRGALPQTRTNPKKGAVDGFLLTVLSFSDSDLTFISCSVFAQTFLVLIVKCPDRKL